MTDKGTEEELQLLSRAELRQRVRQRTSEMENMMDAMVDILIRLDEKGNIAMVNGAVTEILGYEREALTGKPVDILLAEPPPDSQAAVASVSQLLEQLLSVGQVTDMEVYCSTADDDTVPMSISASMLEDEAGIPTGIVCVAKDISERKEAEQQAAFLHSLLRHDLGNRLQVSLGALDMLGDSELDDGSRQHVDRALGAVEDAIELVESVRKLDRIEESESLAPTDLGATLMAAIDSYDQLREEMGVEVETDIDAVSVMGGSLLGELFNNLIENALIHANADLLRVRTEVGTDTVTTVIEDDGDGLDAEDGAEIFDYGYSTGGTASSGLGMFIVGELIESYGGEVTVSESELGGARFDVTLQRADS